MRPLADSLVSAVKAPYAQVRLEDPIPAAYADLWEMLAWAVSHVAVAGDKA
jgi:hypothetical protein